MEIVPRPHHPQHVLPGRAQGRARAGRDAAAWRGGSRSTSSGAVPGGNRCGLHTRLLLPACPHIAPGLAHSDAGHRALPRVKETQPWLLSRAVESLDGFEVVDAPGWCCCWPGACGSSEPALGTGWPWQPGCELQVGTHGCPSTPGASWVPSEDRLVSHGEQRELWGPAHSPCPGPAPGWWLGKLLVWRSRAELKANISSG